MKLHKIGILFVSLSACGTSPSFRKIGLCELAQKSEWIARGSVSSWSSSTRTLTWTGGEPLQVTDITFVADEQFVGSMGSDALLNGPVSSAGLTKANVALRKGDGSPNTLLFFFKRLDANGPIADRGVYEAVGGVYTFDDETVNEGDLQATVEAYRAPAHTCPPL